MNQRTHAPARALWDRIEQIRNQRGWTKVQLARATGVDRTTLDKWRTQPRSPQPPTVKQVAERLGIDHDEALRLAGITAPAVADDEGEDPTDRMERLWRAYKNDPGERGTVLRGLLSTWDEQDEQSGTG